MGLGFRVLFGNQCHVPFLAPPPAINVARRGGLLSQQVISTLTLGGGGTAGYNVSVVSDEPRPIFGISHLRTHATLTLGRGGTAAFLICFVFCSPVGGHRHVISGGSVYDPPMIRL